MGSDEKDKKHVTSYNPITLGTRDGSVLTGKINIAEYSRVSDILLSPEPFIVMIDVVSRDGIKKTRFVNKTNIAWIEPDDVDV